MKTLIIENEEFQIQDKVSDLIIMISKERDELKNYNLTKEINNEKTITQARLPERKRAPAI